MTKRSILTRFLTAASTLALVACQMPSTQPGGPRAGAAPGTASPPLAAVPGARPQVGAQAAIPSGTIVAYYGTDLPAGWVLCDGRIAPGGRRTPDLRNRFIMGLDPASQETLGVAGGTTSHQHAAETGRAREESERIESGRDEHVSDDDHTHPVVVHPANHLPPYVKLVYIMKD
jgi:hypothetical protein